MHTDGINTIQQLSPVLNRRSTTTNLLQGVCNGLLIGAGFSPSIACKPELE